jgi:two-component system, cell cycle sensor histidine kinase and response regulator CckA
MSDSDPRAAELQTEIGVLRARIRELEQVEEEHARTAAALRESEARLRQTTESLPIVLLSAEAGTNRVLLMIGAVQELFGYDRERFVADPEFGPTLIHPDDAWMVHENYVKGLASGRRFEIIYRCVHGVTGEDRWIQQTVVPILADDGSLVRQDCIILDITARKRAEEALRKSEDNYRLLAENSTDMISRHSSDASVLYASPSCAALLGYTADELRGAKGDDYVHPDDREALWTLVRRQFEKGEGYRSEHRMRKKDGEYIWVETIGRPIRDRHTGQVTEIICVTRDITEHKRAERELQFQAMLLDQIRDHITATSLDGRIIYVNETQAQKLKRPKSEIIGQNTAIFGNNSSQGATQTEILDTTLSQGCWRGEVVNRTADGSEIVVDCRTWIIRDEKGQPAALCGVATDITDRKQAETALRQSEERYRLLIENIDLGIAMIDSDYNIIMTNATIGRMAGKLVSELIGCKCFTQFRGTGQRCGECPGAMAMTSGLPAEVEASDVLEDGSTIFVRGRAFPTRGPDGTINGFIEVVEDITQRRRAEKALRESEEHLRVMATGAPIVLFSFDRNGVFLHSEGKALEALGLKPGEAVGRSVFEMYQDHPDLISHVRRALAGESFAATIEISGRSFETWYSPVFDEPGRVSRIVGISTDVTDRKRLQVQLLQSQKLQSIGTLAGGVAHDFGNLLAVIIGNLSIVLRQSSVEAKVKDMLRDVMDAAERASALTHQLLAFARGGLQKPIPTDLNRHVESVLRIVRRTAPRRIEFAVKLAPDLPHLNADPTQLEQVVMNLCLNAIEASQQPSTVEVTTSSETLDARQAGKLELAPGGYIRLCVRDHGSGMDAATIERVFEPFFSTKPTGRGMGLASTQGIVHSHKGQIHMESDLGRGTTVSVWLPVAPGEKRGEEPAPITRPGNLPRGSETILIIDDLESAAHAAQTNLSSLGYCAVSHTSLKSALTFLETNSEDIDLILLGTNTVHSTRNDPLKEIRSRCPKVPILVTGRSPADTTAARLLKRKVAGFVQKPFTLPNLATAIRTALDASSRD